MPVVVSEVAGDVVSPLVEPVVPVEPAVPVEPVVPVEPAAPAPEFVDFVVEEPELVGGTLTVTLVFDVVPLAGAVEEPERVVDVLLDAGGATTRSRTTVVLRVVVVLVPGAGWTTTVLGLSLGTGTVTVLLTTTVSRCGCVTTVVLVGTGSDGRVAK